MPPKNDALRSGFNAFEQNMNLTMEMQKLVNEHLRMEDYQDEVGLPQEHFDIPMDYDDAHMHQEDHVFNFENDFGDVPTILPKRAGMKKQVYAIHQAMMKHDKKTQRNYGAALA